MVEVRPAPAVGRLDRPVLGEPLGRVASERLDVADEHVVVGERPDEETQLERRAVVRIDVLSQPSSARRPSRVIL